MASYKRRAHSSDRGPALRKPRATQSKTAGTTKTSSTRGPRGKNNTSRKPANTHRASSHKRNGGHRVLKWVLGIFFGIIGLGLAIGIGVFAYLYATT